MPLEQRVLIQFCPRHFHAKTVPQYRSQFHEKIMVQECQFRHMQPCCAVLFKYMREFTVHVPDLASFVH